jgi:hypothetical protein
MTSAGGIDAFALGDPTCVNANVRCEPISFGSDAVSPGIAIDGASRPVTAIAET